MFKVILTASWVLTVAAVFLNSTLEHTLPVGVREYVTQRESLDTTVTDTIFLVVGAPLAFGMIASYVGHYFWRRWARTLFLWTLPPIYLLTLLDLGPVIDIGIASWLGEFTCLLDGVLIAALFWIEPIRMRFDAPAETVLQTEITD